jgi:site-specific DNA recombinase
VKRAGVYVRVSTQEQAQEGYSIGAQKERLLSYCKAKDWLVVDVYVDGGFSGSSLDRPAMAKLIEDIDKLDVVLVYKLDRLSRSQKDTLYLIEEVFLPAGVNFVSMNESFDTGTPFGRAMIGILSVFAQLEREQIKERSLMGRIERAKEGLFHGGPFYPIGYDYKDGKLVINEYEAMQVREIYDMYIAGAGDDKIAQTLREKGYTNRYGSWKSTSSIRSVLNSDVYLGIIRYKGVVTEDAHEPIVTPEQFEQAQAIRERKSKIYKKVFVSNSLLQGFLYCGNCGARYYVKHNRGVYKYYTCYSRGKTSKHMIKDPNCKNKSWNVGDLDEKVESEIKKLAFDRSYFEELIKKEAASKRQPVDELNIVKSKITDLDRQINRLMDLYQKETMPLEMVSDRIEGLYQEKLALKKQLDGIAEASSYDFDREGVMAILSDIPLVWDCADTEQKRLIMRSLINRIVINGEDIKIEWSFLSND